MAPWFSPHPCGACALSLRASETQFPQERGSLDSSLTCARCSPEMHTWDDHRLRLFRTLRGTLFHTGPCFQLAHYDALSSGPGSWSARHMCVWNVHSSSCQLTRSKPTSSEFSSSIQSIRPPFLLLCCISLKNQVGEMPACNVLGEFILGRVFGSLRSCWTLVGHCASVTFNRGALTNPVST